MSRIDGKILVVDGDPTALCSAGLLLKQTCSYVKTKSYSSQMISLLKNDAYDVIFVDMNFAQGKTSGKKACTVLGKFSQPRKKVQALDCICLDRSCVCTKGPLL